MTKQGVIDDVDNAIFIYFHGGAACVPPFQSKYVVLNTSIFTSKEELVNID